jgi:signal transduction histidine kinase
MSWPWSATRARPAGQPAQQPDAGEARSPELAALDRLSDAALVLDRTGEVRFANAAAALQWPSPVEKLRGRDARTLLADLHESGSGKPWSADIRPAAATFDDAQGRHLLLRCLPWRDGADGEPLWLLLLVDVTPLRAAQLQCDEALRFLGHDARTPASTIVGMIELAQARKDGRSDEGLLLAIDTQARASLRNADRFVAVSRARIRPLRLEWLDLHALLQQAVDQAWLAGARRRVRLQLAGAQGEAPVRVDRALLAEAFRMLFAELIAEAEPDSSHECRLSEDADAAQWRVTLPQPGASAATPAGVHSAASRLLQVALQRHGAGFDCDPCCAGSLTLRLPRAA